MKNIKWRKNIIIFLSLALLILIIFLFIKNNVYKLEKIGNNIDKKINVSDIWNIKSYEAKIELIVTTKNTTSTYYIEQEVIKNEKYVQKVIEPELLKDMEIIYENGRLEVRNTKLGISKIYEKYNLLTTNFLYLTTFTDEYVKNTGKINEVEDENNRIITIEDTDDNKRVVKTIYISKKSNLPINIEINDITQNIKYNIIYKEIKLNK